MDEDGSSTSVPTASNYNRLPSESVFTDTLPIFVDNEWGSSTTQGVQLCPAIFLASCQNIPQAVKHVYSRLASSSSKVDQGIPELLLSLVATGTHSLNFENSERLTKGFGKIITRCGFWAITSGEQNDPLAAAVAAALRCTLPQQRDSSEETLVIAINSMDVAYQAAAIHSNTLIMTDSRYNTFYMVLNKTDVSEDEMLRFRTCASVNLANPPPALLIGVPDERCSSQQSQKHSHSSSQTPIGSTAPAIILPTSMVSVETRPLPMVLFCASSLGSLLDLQHYLQCGVPVLVVNDSSNLCALLHTSFAFYQNAAFDHTRFMGWLDSELRKIAVSTKGSYKRTELGKAKTAICHILLSTNGEHALLSFISSEDLENLGDHLLKLLVKSATDSADHVRILHLAVKLNSASVLRTVKLESVIVEGQLESLLEEALATDDHIDVLGALLDQNFPVHISSNLLLNWLENTSDQYFFNTIILGHFLGLSYKLEKINEYTANCINDLLYKLSGGISCLFPPEYFIRPLAAFDRGKGIQVLAVWALLLNRIELVKLLCAYSQEPIALSLVLAKISRNLARLSREWFFYEQRLISLSNYLNSTAFHLLDAAYRECPVKAYQALCRQLGSFNQLTLSQLAFETNAREFIAHECCQRWVLRLLYGDLQLRSLSTTLQLPNWLKIVLSSVLVVPTLFWVSVRPSTVANAKRESWSRPVSPTVALLEDGRQVKKVRASSTYSMHSMRSSYAHDTLSISGYNTIHPHQEYNHYGAVEPDTPNSTNQAMQEDADLFLPQHNDFRSSPSTFMPRNNNTYRAPQPKIRRKKERTAGLSLFSMFYSTPITKYWLSLVSRLVYLSLMAFSVALPGCGYFELDIALWLWALMWLIEGLWVLNIRMDNSSWRQMPWTILDICCVSVFLLFLLSVRIAGTYLPKMVQFNSFAYIQKAAWSMFLLYECYKTLFVYIPLSDVLGPLMVRIKLMITRDFVNFVILVLLVVFSSAFAIKALVFPDLGLTISTASESLAWAVSALFTTDLASMKESEQCHRMLLPNQRTSQCQGVGGYADPRCPSQGWLGQLTVVEYLLILKLISWPILFALFARTAKQVDDEADRIWKYQLYSLATTFSLRPSLPPPLTPLFLLVINCCRVIGCIPRWLFNSSSSTDHPDVQALLATPSHKPSTVYRNPSVPSSRTKSQNRYWTRLSIVHWKSLKPKKGVTASKHKYKQLSEKLELLFLFNTTFGSSSQILETVKEDGNDEGNEENQSAKLTIKKENKSWITLMPGYCPPKYSKPASEFALEVQRNVQEDSPQNIIELGKHWRHRKFSELLSTAGSTARLPSHKSYALSCDGLPCNPQGKTGIAGRGEYARFGPNKLFIYVMFINKSDELSVLTTSSPSDLPSKWRYVFSRSDQFLEQLLILIGVQDTEIQLMTSRGYLEVGQAESHLAHVASKIFPSSIDTDNAWTEADVWAADLSYLSDFNLKIDGYEWKPVSSAVFSCSEYQEFVELSLQALNIKERTTGRRK